MMLDGKECFAKTWKGSRTPERLKLVVLQLNLDLAAVSLGSRSR